jgi:hypothetical protein
MDIFIPVGGPQNNDYRELRYTLRSLEKHMLDLGTVYLAGDLPSWLTGVEILNILDIPNNPNRDVQNKLMFFCQQEEPTEDFLFCHDDTLANEDFTAEDLPFYCAQEGQGSIHNPLYFQVHTPVRYNRKYYSELFANPDNNKVASPRAFYLNYYQAPATKIDEVVLRVGAGVKPYHEQIAGAPFYSLNDRAAGKPEFEQMMADLFPEPSKYEL